MGTGSGGRGGWVALAVLVVVAAPVRNAAEERWVAGVPSEVAVFGGCGLGPGAVFGAGSLASGPAGSVADPGDHMPDARGLPSPPGDARRATGPDYYQFPMVSTKRVPGTGNASGVGEVVFAQSPFGVALGEDGSYHYDFKVRFERLKPARGGVYVVWTTTPELDQIVLAGELADPVAFSGKVAWNKFLVVVTLEPAFDPDATMWTGPIVIRGMSRSGMMHTMAGHGPFEEENCAAYGYE